MANTRKTKSVPKRKQQDETRAALLKIWNLLLEAEVIATDEDNDVGNEDLDDAAAAIHAAMDDIWPLIKARGGIEQAAAMHKRTGP